MRITSLSEFQLVPLALSFLDIAHSPYMVEQRRYGSPTVKRKALAFLAASLVRHDRLLTRRP
ncbi:hypothetical protein ZL58_14075 [Salmonella enterica subsp. enterica serovar Typhimurium]|nr:hypothetical protein [Salmonella enterica subsp. enterica serovar Typhimurium]